MGGIGADLEKICGSCRERRTSLAEPLCEGIMAVGKGAESPNPGPLASLLAG